MTAEDQSANGSWTVLWDRKGLVRTEDGALHLPVTLVAEDQQINTYIEFGPDEAALVHAQFDRELTKGWAKTEAEKVARQVGEIYPVGGSGHLA